MNRSPHHVLSFSLIAFACVGCSRTATPGVDPATTGTVKIEVELGDQVHTLTMEGVSDGTSLETVLRSVDEPKFIISGRDTTAFVKQIGDQATGAAEGWTFRIDGEFSNRGIGTAMLHPPTTVTWEYGSMDDDQ